MMRNIAPEESRENGGMLQAVKGPADVQRDDGHSHCSAGSRRFKHRLLKSKEGVSTAAGSAETELAIID